MTGALAVSSDRYPMAALIRFTLIALYLAMVAPLPLLAPAELKLLLWLALPLGLGLVVAATSEAVERHRQGMHTLGINVPECLRTPKSTATT